MISDVINYQFYNFTKVICRLQIGLFFLFFLFSFPYALSIHIIFRSIGLNTANPTHTAFATNENSHHALPTAPPINSTSNQLRR